MIQQANYLYEFGTFSLDAGARLLTHQGKLVPLTPKAVETLLVLVQNPGRVVSKDELINTVWPDTFVEENGLTRNISVLRKALGDSEEDRQFIETIPKRGYRFVANVNERPGRPSQPPEIAIGQATRERLSVNEAPPYSSPAISSERAKREKPGGGIRPGPLLIRIAAGTALIVGALAVLRVVLPSPTPKVLRTVRITSIGSVEGGRHLVTAGRTIYFEECHGQICKTMQVSRNGGDPIPVPTSFSSASVLAASPDSSQLLVETLDGTERDHPLWLLPAIGGSAKRLAGLMGHDGVWMPGGKKILYAKENELWVANEDGNESRKLLSAAGIPLWPRFSLDGKTLRFTIQGPREVIYSLWEASADGTHLHPLLPDWKPPAQYWGEGECCGSWTPDGKYFMFRSLRDNFASFWAIREKGDFFHAASYQPVEIYASHTALGNPVLSTDGKRFLAVNGRNSFELARLVSADHRLVPFLSGIPAKWVGFSPDGRWLAYVDSNDGTLWRFSADGSHRLRLTSPPGSAVFPRWSPDGTQIMFHIVTLGVRRKLCVVPSEGGSVEMLMPGPADEEQADWFPDGKSVLFDRHSPPGSGGKVSRDICVLNLTTRKISALPGSEGLKFSTLCPNGLHATAITEDARKLMLYDFRTRLWTELASGHGIIRAFWTRDGRSVYYQDEYGSEQPIFRVRIADHKTERVTGTKPDIPRDVVDFLLDGVTPDGSPLVTLNRSNSDVYALELDLP